MKACRRPTDAGPGRAAFLARIAVSAGLLGLLVAFVDRGRLIDRFATADARFLVLVLGLATVDRLLMASKWWLLIRGRDAAVSLWTATRAYYLASFTGYFLPMTLGADAVRIAALSGGGRTAGLIASVVLERVVGALAQAVLATVALGALIALGLGARLGPAERWAIGGLVVAAFLMFPLSFRLAARLTARLGRQTGWSAKLGGLTAAYAAYASSLGLIALFFGLTLVEGTFPVAIHYLAGRALGLDPGWTFYIATVPIVFLLARLPVSLGGLGFVELSFVSLAGLLGVGWTDAFSIAGLATALYLVALVPGAILYLWPAPDPLPAPPHERLP
ncbi:MAG: lysylphosphatidylglycerol synthase transmembrane domain-containing protein [Candidatus Rokuibacteriota bacterium]